MAIFSVLTVVFFLILVKKNVLYLEEITGALQRISEGNLEIHIPVRTSDELGKMANTVNIMAIKLKTAIEEERETEKSKNDLITNISHDIRTPLTSILGYLDLLIRMQDKNEEKTTLYSNIAYSQCKELKVLIEDLFEFSKLNNPRIKINKTQVSAGELLEQVMLGFIPAFNEAGIEYRLNFQNKKLMVNADTVLLKRVFDNLINNAIKYGSDGKYIDVELFKENSEAVIRIINYGKFIEDIDLTHIFDRFYRVDKSSSTKKDGTGLGLAIVKSIIDLHNGSIGASCKDDKTIFEVRLRIATTDL